MDTVSAHTQSQVNWAKADKVLANSAKIWFGVALIGIWMFGYYIITYYGASAIQGNLDAWEEGLIDGIIAGDLLGNIAIILHLFVAAIICMGGPLQFIPRIRNNFPRFHRWNGRVYLTTALLISISAVYMVWARGSIGGLFNQIASTFNALLILLAATLTLRNVLARKISLHQAWAFRCFLLMSGVWFFRIGFGLWIFLNGGSAPGSTENLTGPFDMFLAYGQSLVPLFFYELYVFTKQKAAPRGKFAMAVLLLVLSILTGIGIFMAAMIFWKPVF